MQRKAIRIHEKDSDVLQLANGALQNIGVTHETSSLHMAAVSCNSACVRRVLLHDFDEFMDANKQDIKGQTSLHLAVESALHGKHKLLFIFLVFVCNNFDSYCHGVNLKTTLICLIVCLYLLF